MLYGLSQNLCQNYAKTVQKTQHEHLLVNRVVRSQDSCQTIQTVRKYTQKYITTITSISLPTNVVWQPWNACQYSQKLQQLSSSISVHITCCTTSTNPYGMACSSLLSEIHTSLCLGMHALLQQMLSLFSARPLSCSPCSCISPRTSWYLTKSLLLSQQDCCCFPKNGCALLP
jgi:hypothetical protein